MTETTMTQTDARLVTLFTELEACEEFWNKYDPNKNGGHIVSSAGEDDKIADLENSIREKVVHEFAKNFSGLVIKVRSVELLNRIEEMSWDDRIEEANSNAERVAWSLIRDLVESPSLLNRLKEADKAQAA